MFEHGCRAREIERPHPEKAFVEQRDDLFAVGHAVGIPLADGLGVVEPQRFDIGGDQTEFLARRQRFRQCGDVSAGEDVFAGKGIGGARHAQPADGVEQHYAVVLQHVGAGFEEGFELRASDMLEHADRHDPVELATRSGRIAIIFQNDADPVGHSGRGDAFAGEGGLFLRQGNAGHAHVVVLGQMDCHPAPSAADIQHLVACAQRQFPGDMRQLRPLRLGQRHVVAGPVGTGILPVLGIQHQRVEIIADVVVMRDVLLRSDAVVDLFGGEAGAVDQPLEHARLTDIAALVPCVVGAQQADEPHHVAVLDQQPPVHEGLCRAQTRVHDDVARHLVVGEAQHDFGKARRGRAIGTGAAIGEHDAETSLLHAAGQEAIEEGLAHATPFAGNRVMCIPS